MSAQQGGCACRAARDAARGEAGERAGGLARRINSSGRRRPSKPGGWTAPHKPHTKLADVLAKHKGQADWTEPIVDDETLHADYISMAPGKKTPKRMNADTREWWVVQDGQIRFTIDGQEPFVASKGYLVQVPYRNMYTMETVGDRAVAALRGEHRAARGRCTRWTRSPVPLAGNAVCQQVRVPAKANTTEATNRSSISTRWSPAPIPRVGSSTTTERVANIILGRGIPPPPLTNKGHFHEESAEFWFILLDKIRYNIEGVPVFVADQGDIVYVPKQRWHLASFGGDGAVVPARDERVHGPRPLGTR